MQLIVGRIGKPHGTRGEVTVEIRTDSPEERFSPGSVLATDPTDRGPLTIDRMLWHGGKLILGLSGITNRDAAARLRNTLLVVDSADLPTIDDPDEFYDHQLVGLSVASADGTHLGVVSAVVHGPMGELLAVARSDGGELLVPFVRDFVPTVDLVGKRVVIDPPDGLLEL